MKLIIHSVKVLLFVFSSILAIVLTAQPEFVPHVVTESFTKGVDVIAVDLDQDEAVDIVAVNSYSNAEVAWWKNNGNNEFIKITIRGGLNKVRSINGDGKNPGPACFLTSTIKLFLMQNILLFTGILMRWLILW